MSDNKTTTAASTSMQEYFSSINETLQGCYAIAKAARIQHLDPEPDVPIPVAKNMAERVVGLISVVAPKIMDTTIPFRITELEKEYGQLDWRVGFRIAEEVAQEKFCKFETKHEAIEVGIRVGFAYLTLGIVSAPLEGLIGIQFKKRKDGKEYVAVQYAGPIRAAGGTAASTSVVLADYVRTKMGYATYDPDEQEINRAALEVHDYHDRVTNLQYHPSDEELKFLVSHLPVEIDGDPTETFEVSNYKDLPRIKTNFIRGGVALVLAEGLSQKATKVWKRLSKWGKEFGLEWGWLAEFIKLKEEIHAAHAGPSQEGSTEKKIKPNNTFITDLVAGRPILTHPLAEGGFRLRYGRTRATGFSAAALSPATLQVLDKYIAIGTQLKVERPGEAATVTVCEVLDGPIVRTNDGTVLYLHTEEEAKQVNKEVEEILFLGDIMFNYGDFSENGHRLVPAGYCPEWWVMELEKELIARFGKECAAAASAASSIEEKYLQKILTDYFYTLPTLQESITLSKTFGIPLHPKYTFYWKLVTGKELYLVASWLAQGNIKLDEGGTKKIILPYYGEEEMHLQGKRVLEELGVPHLVVGKENVVLEKTEASIFSLVFNFATQEELMKLTSELSLCSTLLGCEDGLSAVNAINAVQFRDKAGTFIGARMGRPEKAKMRHLTGSPQVMFPVGDEGGRLRSFQSALEHKKVVSTFPLFYCTSCQQKTIYPSCERCSSICERKYHCRFCGDLTSNQCRHGRAVSYKTFDLDIGYYLKKAKEKIKEHVLPELIKGVRGTSNKDHYVEHLAKGILRAKHQIYVNKDGTTRYDCTELPLTHFKPKEIKTSIETLRQLGYKKDIYGAELADSDQILELKPQDVILPGFDSLDESAPQVLFRVARFVDELLEKLYGLSPYYNLRREEDLVGHLVIGLAPHISAGLVGRIIGFSETQGLITHPMYHAGLRRDCDGDEACVMLLMDALLNFSRQYLPEKRGAKTMDAPLVLTSTLYPSEVDDQVHGMDIVWRYPLELYEASLEMKNPWEVKWGEEQKKVGQIGDRLGTPEQYESFGFTHPVDNFNKGVQCSAYKTAPSMEEKLLGQMEIAKKVRAVDMDDVAKLVIQKHFLKDIKGNLRKFSMQQFRCVKCNDKYRRPPLTGTCRACNGRLIFTISEGSVTKYLAPSLLLAKKYQFSPYLKQILEVLQTDVNSVFGKEKDTQVGLGAFLG